MEKINNNLKMPPLAGFVVGILKSNNIPLFKKEYSFSGNIFGKNDEYNIFYIKGEDNITKLTDILKTKFSKSELEIKDNHIIIKNNIETVEIIAHKFSFIENIKYKLFSLFKN